MKLIVGLGNPGEEYKKTRHNVGFMLLDRLSRSSFRKNKSGLMTYSWLGSELELIKPQTFMNKSGEAVAFAANKHNTNPDSICVIHDDLDIKFGEFKFQKGKGPKDHGGVGSVEKVLGSENFWRVRVGIESRAGEEKNIPGEKFVLTKFLKSELEILNSVFDEIIEVIGEWSA